MPLGIADLCDSRPADVIDRANVPALPTRRHRTDELAALMKSTIWQIQNLMVEAIASDATGNARGAEREVGSRGSSQVSNASG